MVLIGLVWLSSAGEQSSATEELTFSMVQADIANGAKLYDVRTPAEFAAGHFSGAINYSVETLEAGKLPSDPTTTKLYVYCRSGNRSATAASILEKAGYQVVDLGGLPNVQALGGTLVQ